MARDLVYTINLVLIYPLQLMENGFGNTQNWGFAPARKLFERANTILVDCGDLRYILKNAHLDTQLYMYERNISVIAKLFMRFAILSRIRCSET